MTERPTTRLAGVLIAAALTASACSGAEDPGPEPVPEATAAPVASPTEDPGREAVLDALLLLDATVEAGHGELITAAATGDVDAARRAVAWLTADPALRSGDAVTGDVTPLLPGPAGSRQETVDYGDAFTTGLEAARDGGGTVGADLARLLSDTVAGDLGAWQRDAAGVLAAVDAASQAEDLERAEDAILALPGEGTRALAWATFAARSDDPDRTAAAAERAIAHLDIIRFAVDQLLGGTTTDDGA